MRELRFIYLNVSRGVFGKFLSKLKEKNLEKLRKKKIRKIIIIANNKIGDGIVLLPFILELAKNYEVTVVVSNYNKFIFEAFKSKLKIIETKEASEILKGGFNIEQAIIRVFQYIIYFYYFFIKRKSLRNYEYDLLIDFVGFPYFVKDYVNKARFIASKNAGEKCFGYDYVYEEPSSYPPRKTHFEIHINFLKKLIPDFKFRKNNSFIKYLLVMPPDEIKKIIFQKRRFLVVNVGGHPVRRVNLMYIEKILNLFPYYTVVIDNPGLKNIKKIRNRIKNKNVIFIKKTYSLQELLNLTYSKNCSGYIEFDCSGASHFFEVPTNSLKVFTVTHHEYWKPFSNNKFVKVLLDKKEKTWLEYVKDEDNLMKATIYKDGCDRFGDVRKRGMERCFKLKEDVFFKAFSKVFNSKG